MSFAFRKRFFASAAALVLAFSVSAAPAPPAKATSKPLSAAVPAPTPKPTPAPTPAPPPVDSIYTDAPNDPPFPIWNKPTPRDPFKVGYRPGLLDEALAGPLKDLRHIVFATRTLSKNGHWYANFGYWCPWPDFPLYGERGKLCVFDVREKKLATLIDDPEGAVRDPQLSYDGRVILFSYRRGGQPYYNLYEIGLDGSNLRRLTDNPYDDIEPTYLPDGGIMFASSRCNRWVNCFLTPVAILYRLERDGTIRAISSNNEHDNTPWPMPDGRVLYTRWEYIDRSQMVFHHLWAMNPDGTNQTVFYGNMHPGWVMIDAKPIPGSDSIVCSFNPKHGRIEHTGEIRIVDPRKGPDDLDSARRITMENKYVYHDPYPLGHGLFLVALNGRMDLLNEQGEWETIYELPDEDLKACAYLHEPRPVAARAVEPVVPPRVRLERETGAVILADVAKGRNMEGVRPGEIKKLLVLEVLPMPVHFQGGMRPITVSGSFTLERVLGTVPVEPDGSAYAELPALRSLFFVALDENDLAVKRMRSFLTLQPGETTSCVGCHERREETPIEKAAPRLEALKRPPSRIEPYPGVPEVFDFPRDIQPILDAHCVTCHNPLDYQGGMSLAGDRGPQFSHSYFQLTARRQLADGRNRERGNDPPRLTGSAASPLMQKILEGHHEVKLSEHEIAMVRLWLDSAAVYPGTYAALATGAMRDTLWTQAIRLDMNLPEALEGQRAISRRCNSCHTGAMAISPGPSLPVNFLDRRFSSEAVWNLSRPELSMALRAPLAKEAGGLGICQPKDAKTKAEPVFASVEDPDYRAILACAQAAKGKLEEVKRFDMPGFRPRQEYIREMQKYGILPSDLGPGDPIDIYATDKAYWESFWHRPEPLAAAH